MSIIIWSRCGQGDENIGLSSNMEPKRAFQVTSVTTPWPHLFEPQWLKLLGFRRIQLFLGKVFVEPGLQALLFCEDEKVVRVLRRVLSELEIGVEHCPDADVAVQKITRQRFEAVIIDCAFAD